MIVYVIEKIGKRERERKYVICEQPMYDIGKISNASFIVGGEITPLSRTYDRRIHISVVLSH